MNGDEFPDLLPIFRTEASEIIDALVETISRLRYGKATEYEEELGLAFRLAHNLKGSARAVGLETIDHLAHAIEDMLSPFRESQDKPTDQIFEEIVSLIQKIENDLYDSPAAEPEDRLSGDTAPSQTTTTDRSGDPGGSFIKVPSKILDELSNNADDLVTIVGKQEARAAFLQQVTIDWRLFINQLPSELQTGALPILSTMSRFMQKEKAETNQYARQVDNFRSAMVAARMQPLMSQAPTWRRIARDIASVAGKKVRLSIQVDNIELDKHVLDSLRDPMVHLIRNAVDHGIETPTVRKKKKKVAEGTITISARVTGARIEIDILDDGQGFDGDRILSCCESKKLHTAEQLTNLTLSEKLDLVFLPGLSTANSVSNISGRGVGLDVVRRSLETIGGVAQVIPDRNKQYGQGIRLTVPVSILTSRGLLVRCNDAKYLIPSMQVENTIRVAFTQIQRVDGRDSVTLSDREPLPLCLLAGLLGHKNETTTLSKFLNLIVFKDRSGSRGFVVDHIEKVDDFVIKSLPSILPRLPGINGVAILGDGSLAIEVDLVGIATMGTGSHQVLRDADEKADILLKRILVVDDSLTSRTLERNILVAAGYEVVVADDGAKAWEILKKENFAVVVSDVEMPEMNGFELTRKIRASKKWKDLPIILVTSLAKDAHRKEGQEAGANAYIIKSRFEQKILLEEVAKYG